MKDFLNKIYVAIGALIVGALAFISFKLRSQKKEIAELENKNNQLEVEKITQKQVGELNELEKKATEIKKDFKDNVSKHKSNMSKRESLRSNRPKSRTKSRSRIGN